MLELLALAAVIAIEPLPLIAFILVLGTDRGVRNGAAFIAGWTTTLVVILGVTLAVTGGEPLRPSTAPANGVEILRILLGVVLLVVAFRVQRRPSDQPRTEPAWAKRLDRLTPVGAAALGVLLQAWPLVAAGASTATRLKLSVAGTITALVLFCAVATALLVVLEVFTVRSPERAGQRLGAFHGWLDRHRDTAIVVVSVAVGLWLIVNGIRTLAT